MDGVWNWSKKLVEQYSWYDLFQVRVIRMYVRSASVRLTLLPPSQRMDLRQSPAEGVKEWRRHHQSLFDIHKKSCTSMQCKRQVTHSKCSHTGRTFYGKQFEKVLYELGCRTMKALHDSEDRC